MLVIDLSIAFLTQVIIFTNGTMETWAKYRRGRTTVANVIFMNWHNLFNLTGHINRSTFSTLSWHSSFAFRIRHHTIVTLGIALIIIELIAKIIDWVFDIGVAIQFLFWVGRENSHFKGYYILEEFYNIAVSFYYFGSSAERADLFCFFAVFAIEGFSFSDFFKLGLVFRICISF